MAKEALYTRFDNIFFEKTRLSMLTVLYKEESVSFNRFKIFIGGTDGAIFAHLQKLLDAGYITQKKEIVGDRAQTVYKLTKSGKKLFQDYMKFLEKMINDKTWTEV